MPTFTEKLLYGLAHIIHHD